MVFEIIVAWYAVLTRNLDNLLSLTVCIQNNWQTSAFEYGVSALTWNYITGNFDRWAKHTCSYAISSITYACSKYS